MDPMSRAAVDTYFLLRSFLEDLRMTRSGVHAVSGPPALKRKLHDCVESIIEQARGPMAHYSPLTPHYSTGDGLLAPGTDNELLDRIIPYLRKAKIFSIPPEFYVKIWNLVDASLIKGADLGPYDCAPSTVELGHRITRRKGLLKDAKRREDLSSYQEYLLGVAHLNPFPQNLPFNNMYFGYGEGVPISSWQKRFRLNLDLSGWPTEDGSRDFVKKGEEWRSIFDDFRVAGHLITETGDVYEFNSYVAKSPVVLPVSKKGIGINTVASIRALTPLARQDMVQGLFEEASYLMEKEGHELLGGVKDFRLVVDPEFSFGGLYGEDAAKVAAWSAKEVHVPLILVRVVKGFCYYSVRIGFPFKSFDELTHRRWESFKALDKKHFSGCWEYPWTFSSYTVPTLIDLINENNKSFVVKNDYPKDFRRSLTKKHKKRLPKGKKGKRSLPAYYVIDVGQKSLLRAIPKATKSVIRRGHALSYRHDRDAHERVFVRRGELPMAIAERDLLTLRGYAIYTEGQPDPQDRKRLVRRRLPFRQEGEWLALKTTWVQSTIVGDESLPYKPAVRRLSEGGLESLLKTGSE